MALGGDVKEEVLVLNLFVFISMIDPSALVGSSLGAMFFLSLPKVEGESRILLPIFSLGVGYVAAIEIGGSYPMLTGVTVSSLGSTLFSVLHAMLISGGSLPPWLQDIVSSILRLRK